MKTSKAVVLTIYFMAAMLACSGPEKSRNSTSPAAGSGGGMNVAAPPVIIYKTTGDYRNLVPVVLNEEKTAIVSYPAPSDIYYKAELALPVQLSEGFLLDQRGIDQNAAFLDISYKDYAGLKKTPSADSLMKHIIDKDPFLIIYKCGNRNDYDNLRARLNRMIEAGDFGRCIRMDK